MTHTYLHHVTRIDHRHNFSPYNTQLYLTSAFPSLSPLRLESLAFIPQLLLSCVLIPLATAKKDLPASMLAQTFAFVTFNKVCTSQVRVILLAPPSPLPFFQTQEERNNYHHPPHPSQHANSPLTPSPPKKQYFLWYMVFLPLYLPGSSFLRGRALGPAALALWVAGQGLWLQQGFGLEFLGRSTFLPGLWLSSLAFFLVNCWVLGVIVGDVVRRV